MTLKNILSILSNFSILYSKFDDEQKKRSLQVLIEEIEINKYDEKRADYSKVIKSVKFRFPLNINGEETYKVYLTNETDVETVVLLSRQNPAL